MKTSKIRAEIAALRDAALEDLMVTTDAELHKEALHDGEDLDAIALKVKTTMREAYAGVLRQRLVQAKERMQQKPRTLAEQVIRPPLERIKIIVRDLFINDPSLGLAFRDGKKQTGADWLSLYDDLVAMGAIKPDNNGY